MTVMSAKPINLLAVSYYYPPANNPRAVQVSRLFEYLDDVSTVLVCGDKYSADDRIDPTANIRAETFVNKCLRVKFAQPSWKRASARVAYQFGIQLWEKSPDRYRDWKSDVLRAVQDFTGTTAYKPDVIITFGSPMSDHLIGLEWKKRYQVPWIAHFSDPWADNPLKGYNSLHKRINFGMERSVIKNADRVVFTSQETVDLVMNKYAKRHATKARVLPHAYEPRLFAKPEKRNGSSIVVRYLGDLYMQRTPAPLFRALKTVLSSDARLLEGVRFEFVGTNTDFNLSDIGYDDLPKGLVEFRPTVDYVSSLALMSSADGLMVIDAPASKSVFLPSKLIDYIGAARPVMGITPPGTAASLIDELGGWVIDPRDDVRTEQTVRSFISFLRERSKDSGCAWGNPLTRKRFEPNTVAANFKAIVAELV